MGCGCGLWIVGCGLWLSRFRHIHYGHHMAYNMALGFLFLQGGMATFGRSPQAIAALMCSLYPRFPAVMRDGQYHLQALRHLYVLAIDRRYLTVRDVDTGREVFCPVSMELSATRTLARCVAPCVLPQYEMGARLSIDSPRCGGWVGGVAFSV